MFLRQFAAGAVGLEGLAAVAGLEQAFPRVAEGAFGLVAEPVAFEPDAVEAADASGVALEGHEGGHVMDDAGHAADVGVLADGDEVVDGGGPADVDVVLDEDVARELDGVGDDAVVADHGVVADVGVCHDEVVIAHPGEGLVVGGALMDGDALADVVVVADDQDRCPRP